MNETSSLVVLVFSLAASPDARLLNLFPHLYRRRAVPAAGLMRGSIVNQLVLPSIEPFPCYWLPSPLVMYVVNLVSRSCRQPACRTPNFLHVPLPLWKSLRVIKGFLPSVHQKRKKVVTVGSVFGEVCP